VKTAGRNSFHQVLSSEPVSAVTVQVGDIPKSFPTVIDDGADLILPGSNVWDIFRDASAEISPVATQFSLANDSSLSSQFTALVDFHIHRFAGPVIARPHRAHVADVDVEQQLGDIASSESPEIVDHPEGSDRQSVEDPDQDVLEVGNHDQEEVRDALDRAVERAVTSGASSYSVSSLSDLFLFRIFFVLSWVLTLPFLLTLSLLN
jgi:hypothetical protein